MTPHQKIFALIVSISLFLAIFEMVRRRKVKEEYSWLWLIVSVAMLILVLWDGLLYFMSRLIGAEDPLTTLFLFGFLFLLLVNIDYSIKISGHKEQIKKLAQWIGILSEKLENLKGEKK